jgi:hypothetical protein
MAQNSRLIFTYYPQRKHCYIQRTVTTLQGQYIFIHWLQQEKFLPSLTVNRVIEDYTVAKTSATFQFRQNNIYTKNTDTNSSSHINIFTELTAKPQIILFPLDHKSQRHSFPNNDTSAAGKHHDRMICRKLPENTSDTHNHRTTVTKTCPCTYMLSKTLRRLHYLPTFFASPHRLHCTY